MFGLDPEVGRLPVPEFEVASGRAFVPLVDLDPEPRPLVVRLVLAQDGDLEEKGDCLICGYRD